MFSSNLMKCYVKMSTFKYLSVATRLHLCLLYQHIKAAHSNLYKNIAIILYNPDL